IPADTLYWHDGMSKWAVISDLFAAGETLASSLPKDAANAGTTTVPASLENRALILAARGQRSIYIWENPECSIKPRSFENRAQGFLQATQEKLPAVRFNL